MITIHSKKDFIGMRASGLLAAMVLDYITPYVKPGVSTNELDKLCHDFIIKHKGVPACLGYKIADYIPPYPKTICTSINNVVAHGVPNDIPLKSGDIFNIDVTVIVDGWHGDTSRMYYVGDVSPKAKKLVNTTYNALMLGIAQAIPGKKFGDIGYAIQTYIEKQGYSTVRDYGGHGIGRQFHDPSLFVHHHGKQNTGDEILPGMFFTIEPMINIGKHATKVLDDQWTVVTKDGSLSAQFEHTIGITENGAEIFTRSPDKLYKPPYFSNRNPK